MKRTRLLTLGLLAALALSAVGAGLALAEPPDEYVVTGAVSATGTNTQTFTVNAGKVECKKSSGTSAVGVGNHKTIETNSITYTECKAFGVAATVKFEGCNYNFLEPLDLEEEGKDLKHSGKVTLVCPKGKTAVISTAVCTVTVPGQGPLGTVEGINSGANLLAKASVEAIEYTETGEKCPNIKKSPETFKNGKYKGELKALNVTIN